MQSISLETVKLAQAGFEYHNHSLLDLRQCQAGPHRVKAMDLAKRL